MKKKWFFGRFWFRLGLIYLKLLGQNIKIMNLNCPIDENRKIQNFIRWIDVRNEILKIKWVNKYIIISDLRDWKIFKKEKYIYMICKIGCWACEKE